MSDDPFWKEVERCRGPVTPRLRELPVLRQCRDRFASSSDNAKRDQALGLALQILAAAETVAADKAETQLRLRHRPTPPEWWCARHRAMFERLRVLQSEALRLFGVDQPIPRERVAEHVERLERDVRPCGKSATLAYPDDSPPKLGLTGITSEPTAGVAWLLPATFTAEVVRSTITADEVAAQPFDPSSPATMPWWPYCQGLTQRIVWSGIDDADLALPREQEIRTIFSSSESARAYSERLWLESLQGSPLYRVALIESAVVSRTFGCDLHEAGLFLLCDIIPEAHWIEVTQGVFDLEVASGMRAASVHIAVPSGEVPVSEVAAAYAAHIGMFSAEGRPRTSPKSDWPSRVVAFVLQYRREHGGRPRMAEIYAAWKAENPDCPVYPTLQSFRVTFNRVNKRERSA